LLGLNTATVFLALQALRWDLFGHCSSRVGQIDEVEDEEAKMRKSFPAPIGSTSPTSLCRQHSLRWHIAFYTFFHSLLISLSCSLSIDFYP
jgi:hypothetical protein